MHKNNQKISDILIPMIRDEGGKLQTRLIDVPGEAIETGYDAIRILPLPGDGRYVIGHVRLMD